jgi:flavin reductase (DIM6/NTAB) family NADH-FMN oxidoreductase RutF
MPAFPVPDHVAIEPSILYFGTPVVLVTTMNADGTVNISPMSSAWALGRDVVLGLGAAAQGAENLRHGGECVLNFPSSDLWPKVERIARATGRNPVPSYKQRIGFEYVADKFSLGGFTPIPAETVRPPRIAECPLQFEARVKCVHGGKPDALEGHLVVETEVLRIHAHRAITIPGSNHIDTARWSPLLYVFRHYFGTGERLGKTFRAEC